LELRPAHVEAMMWLARALAAEGKLAEAEEYRERIQQNTVRLQSIQNLTDELGRSRIQTDLLIQIGDESRAANVDERGYHWYLAAVETDPNSKVAHERLARHYREIGNIERAEEHERKAKNCPDRPVAPSIDKRKESAVKS
jgi:tetratricopeptide (TPR) repeat protein